MLFWRMVSVDCCNDSLEVRTCRMKHMAFLFGWGENGNEICTRVLVNTKKEYI